ncbi:uncharacterized protein ACBT57_007234 isoform 1-T1 [Dama dama]
MSQRTFICEGEACTMPKRMSANLADKWIWKGSLRRENRSWMEYQPLENFRNCEHSELVNIHGKIQLTSIFCSKSTFLWNREACLMPMCTGNLQAGLKDALVPKLTWTLKSLVENDNVYPGETGLEETDRGSRKKISPSKGRLGSGASSQRWTVASRVAPFDKISQR